ncbi:MULTISPECIES: hypothetical protein [Amycolatopsis]|uniref:Uncharacterized protein n=2 Tax=Amycolatopsis TaxID=1813 RepID=A0A229S472_9PSEU|nr:MULTISPECIES: hypothetical protein [Amycolatopsis]AXB41285.1 hypothetical protein A4R43_01095 [Amycolatopsis albispora]OXM53752.1 hypothetical protein CFP71_21305 [Amycolatopsis thailandensis]
MSGKLRFGYNKGLPSGVTTAWGCRAIVGDGFGIDVPPDRESGFGDHHTLTGYLRDHCGDAWMAKATAMFEEGEIFVGSDREITLFDDDRAAIKANPRRSYGYLYVCAYFKPRAAERIDDGEGFASLRELLDLGGHDDE